MLKFIFTVTVAISMGQLAIAVGGENKNQLITEDDFTNLSEIRVRTIKFPVETKCKLYQAKLREIFADEHGDSVILFARVIDYLLHKDSPIRNPQSVINDMVQCQTATILQQLENTSPQQRDNQREARNQTLGGALEKTRQAELQAKQASLEEANESLKQKDLELRAARQLATSQQAEFSKKLEERLEIEIKLKIESKERQMQLDQVGESLRQKNLELEEEKRKQLAANEKFESIEKLHEGEIATLQDKQKQLDELDESLRRKDLELIETKQSAARELSELTRKFEEEKLVAERRTRTELQAKQALLDEANDSLKRKDLELEEAKQSASSEQSELGKQLEERRLEVENKLQAELREKQMLLDEVSESLRQKNLELEKERTKQSAASEKYGSIEKLYEETVALLHDKQKQLDESNESLRRKDLELTETKQITARQQSELTRKLEEEKLVAERRTQAELQAKQALSEASNSLKQRDHELDELRVALDSSRQKLNQCEQARADKDRREADDRAREQEEQRLREEEKQRLRIEEEQRLREERERKIREEQEQRLREEEKQRLRKEEEQRQREEELRRKEEQQQELGDYSDQAKVLYNAMTTDGNAQSRCAKYLLLFTQTGTITRGRVEALARLEHSELMRAVDDGLYGMTMSFLTDTLRQQYDTQDSDGRRIFDEIFFCEFG